jgi:ADP-heptose:LPS heptosyltransferase
MTSCDHVIIYNLAEPWGAEEAAAFGYFDLVVNTRYDADSIARIKALDHEEACGFENVDIPESACKNVYRRYIPLSRWDDYNLRRETSVTEQGSELVRLYTPDYHCHYISFCKMEFISEAPTATDTPRIVFVVGASDPAKSWGLERFLEVARFVFGIGIRPLFLLGPLEKGFETRIEKAGFEVGFDLPFRKIAGYFDPDYGTVCVVGNDTGLMHLACAIGAPSVTIIPFGFQFTWFPYTNDPRAIHRCIAPACSAPMCSTVCPRLAQCINQVSTSKVESEILALLNQPPRRKHHDPKEVLN